MTVPVTPEPSTSEPVVIAHAVTVILGALVGLGWLNISDPVIDLTGTGVALVIATAAAVIARGKVTPVSKTNPPTPADIKAMVADAVRAELATLTAYRAATNTAAPARDPQATATLGAHAAPDWRGR